MRTHLNNYLPIDKWLAEQDRKTLIAHDATLRALYHRALRACRLAVETGIYCHAKDPKPGCPCTGCSATRACYEELHAAEAMGVRT